MKNNSFFDDDLKAKKVWKSFDLNTYKNSNSNFKIQTKTAKACLNMQVSKPYIFKHNSREEEEEKTAKYTFTELENFNEYSCSAKEAEEKFQKLLEQTNKNYFQRTKQRIQTKNLRYSAVVTINENHTLKDINLLAQELENKFGWQTIQTSIHRDEGHFLKDENGEFIKDDDGKKIFDPNLHAHIEFLTLDRDGINRLKTRDKWKIGKELQNITAEVLQMERGRDYHAHKEKPPKHLNRWQYAAKMEKEEQLQAKIKSQNKELAKLQDLKEINKELREKLKENNANRADYANLESWKKELENKIRAKELNILELQKEKEEQLLKIEELKNNANADYLFLKELEEKGLKRPEFLRFYSKTGISPDGSIYSDLKEESEIPKENLRNWTRDNKFLQIRTINFYKRNGIEESKIPLFPALENQNQEQKKDRKFGIHR